MKFTFLFITVLSLASSFASTAVAQSINAKIQAITDIQLTPENQHLNYVPNCAPGYTMIGSVIDSGNGISNGHQFFCAKFERVAFKSNARVVTDFVVMDAQHIPGGLQCPSKYQSIGTVTDCSYGKCYGNQTVCVRHQLLDPWMQNSGQPYAGRLPLGDLFITEPGAHVVGGLACPTGFQTAGNVADCGNGQCYGNQIFCKR